MVRLWQRGNNTVPNKFPTLCKNIVTALQIPLMRCAALQIPLMRCDALQIPPPSLSTRTPTPYVKISSGFLSNEKKPTEVG
jgi:hypothetical protein